jgi:hypothetical protein
MLAFKVAVPCSRCFGKDALIHKYTQQRRVSRVNGATSMINKATVSGNVQLGGGM